jgi:hypothetical protein
LEFTLLLGCLPDPRGVEVDRQCLVPSGLLINNDLLDFLLAFCAVPCIIASFSPPYAFLGHDSTVSPLAMGPSYRTVHTDSCVYVRPRTNFVARTWLDDRRW